MDTQPGIVDDATAEEKLAPGQKLGIALLALTMLLLAILILGDLVAAIFR